MISFLLQMNECKTLPIYMFCNILPSLSTTSPTNLPTIIESKNQKRMKKLNIFRIIRLILCPILPLSCFKPQGKHGSLLVLASNPCFLEKGVLERCKTDWEGSLGCHWSSLAYTIRIPSRRTPWVSTLHVAALLSPLTHKPGPA